MLQTYIVMLHVVSGESVMASVVWTSTTTGPVMASNCLWPALMMHPRCDSQLSLALHHKPIYLVFILFPTNVRACKLNLASHQMGGQTNLSAIKWLLFCDKLAHKCIEPLWQSPCQRLAKQWRVPWRVTAGATIERICASDHADSNNDGQLVNLCSLSQLYLHHGCVPVKNSYRTDLFVDLVEPRI